jgi:2-polyprenyl-3-methyl-5-hydroxy-6-metoxy-1,4-benzoquinol methylase
MLDGEQQMECKTPEEVYASWFNHIQSIHATNPNRHSNQASYDATLRDNYPWAFWNLKQNDLHLVCHDIGCAYGTLSLGAYTLGYKVYAVDIVDEYVNAEALSFRGIPFIQHDIESGPVPDVPEADVVLFTEVLEHLNSNPIRAICNVRNMMKPGALLILSTPRFEDSRHYRGRYQVGLDPVERWTDIPLKSSEEWIDAHTYLYTEVELRQLLDLCGFKILQTGNPWGGLTTGITAYKTIEVDTLVTARAYQYVELMQEKSVKS